MYMQIREDVRTVGEAGADSLMKMQIQRPETVGNPSSVVQNGLDVKYKDF